MAKLKKYTVYYTKTTQGSIVVEAKSQEEARNIVEEGGDIDFGDATEYDEALDAYDVERFK
jgi:hypothetical protein